MKLGIIEFIEEAMEKISIDSYALDSATNDIEGLLKFLLSEEDSFLNVVSRVKTPDSVKEKILKQNLYKKYDTVEGLIGGISDIIGLRIECRFIPDEEKIYNKLIEIFDVDLGNGYYSSEENMKVAIKLDEPQPQYQKNGFEIYKIDGKYFTEDGPYNFELQIKSMVNTFWGDIEHRILYKNYNYILSETFIKDMMSSIKENLSLIDKQLRVVYDHVFNLEPKSNNLGIEQMKDVLKKMTYDIYFYKIRNQLGFVVDFRNIVDLIVDYVFMKENSAGEKTIGKDFLNILNRLYNTMDREQNFDNAIILEEQPEFVEEKEKILGEEIVDIINKDFRWNIFFRIVFDIESCERHKVIEKFVRYLNLRFRRLAECATRSARFVNGREEEVIDFIHNAIIEAFIKDLNVETLDDNSLEKVLENIQGFLTGIATFRQWEEEKNLIKCGILEIEIEYKI